MSNTRPDKKRTIAIAHLALVPAGTKTTPESRGFSTCPCTKNRTRLAPHLDAFLATFAAAI